MGAIVISSVIITDRSLKDKYIVRDEISLKHFMVGG
ncbi:hypothetical protein V461_06360 [Pantoea ananatis BRT98]|nr:hypothetical protein V461_06360 [Pantoea ananatis BRT98]